MRIGISEQFSVSPPVDDGTQGRGGIHLVQMILELELEPRPRCFMTFPFLKHLANVSGEILVTFMAEGVGFEPTWE